MGNNKSIHCQIPALPSPTATMQAKSLSLPSFLSGSAAAPSSATAAAGGGEKADKRAAASSSSSNAKSIFIFKSIHKEVNRLSYNHQHNPNHNSSDNHHQHNGKYAASVGSGSGGCSVGSKKAAANRRLEDIKIFLLNKNSRKGGGSGGGDKTTVPENSGGKTTALGQLQHRFLSRKLKSYFQHGSGNYKNLDRVDSAPAKTADVAATPNGPIDVLKYDLAAVVALAANAPKNGSLNGRSKSSNAFVYEEYYDLIVGGEERSERLNVSEPLDKTAIDGGHYNRIESVPQSNERVVVGVEESFYESTVELDKFINGVRVEASADSKDKQRLLIVPPDTSNLYSIIALNEKHKKASRKSKFKTKKLNNFLLSDGAKTRKPFSFFLAKAASQLASATTTSAASATASTVDQETRLVEKTDAQPTAAAEAARSTPQVPAKCFDPLKEFSQQSSSSDLNRDQSSGVSSMSKTSRLSAASLSGSGPKPPESILKTAPPEPPQQQPAAIEMPPAVADLSIFYQSINTSGCCGGERSRANDSISNQYQSVLPDYESIRTPELLDEPAKKHVDGDTSISLTKLDLKRSSNVRRSGHSKCGGGGRKKLMASHEQLLPTVDHTSIEKMNLNSANQIYYSFIQASSSSQGSSVSLT